MFGVRVLCGFGGKAARIFAIIVQHRSYAKTQLGGRACFKIGANARFCSDASTLEALDYRCESAAASPGMRWRVRLVRLTRDGEIVPISQASPVRSFQWR